MLPDFKPGDRVIIYNWAYSFKSPKTGDIVIAKVKDKLLIKRIALIKGSQVFLAGDNPEKSTDSRSFGFIDVKDVLGKVVKHISL